MRDEPLPDPDESVHTPPGPPDAAGPQRSAGVLTDEDILTEVRSGLLIETGFSAANIKQACYELRAGNVYYDLTGGNERIVLRNTNDYILIKPHQLVAIITEESLQLPPDILGRILMKGRLFSVGLQPINTYADPGFAGRLGIVIYNSSPNYIRVEQKDAIAKIEFERLHKPVRTPYRGQHGYQTEIWPISQHMVMSQDDARRDPRVGTLGEELGLTFGKDVGNLIDRIFRFERRLILVALSYILIALVVVVYAQSTDNRLSTVVAIALGLVTNIVSSVLIFAATRITRSSRRPN